MAKYKRQPKRKFILDYAIYSKEVPTIQLIECKSTESMERINKLISLYDLDETNVYTDYKWKSYIHRSCFDVFRAFFFRKKYGIKTHRIYSYNSYEDVYNLLNRSMFDTYKFYFSKIFKIQKESSLTIDNKAVRVD